MWWSFLLKVVLFPIVWEQFIQFICVMIRYSVGGDIGHPLLEFTPAPLQQVVLPALCCAAHNLPPRASFRILFSMKLSKLLDNFIERFWRNIKYEKIYLEPSDNGLELYHKIRDYIKFYNMERSHQGLGYKRPIEM